MSAPFGRQQTDGSRSSVGVSKKPVLWIHAYSAPERSTPRSRTAWPLLSTRRFPRTTSWSGDPVGDRLECSGIVERGTVPRVLWEHAGMRPATKMSARGKVPGRMTPVSGLDRHGEDARDCEP